jgi:DNA-binding MarR family transcriptional regulator
MSISGGINEKQEKVSSLLHSGIGMNLWVLLDQVCTLVKKARTLELRHFNFTLAEAEILFILTHENRGLTLAEIADWNGRELNSISIRVNKMGKRGLVKKPRSSGERQRKVFLTEKGRELYSAVRRQSVEMVFTILSEEEKEQLEPILKKLRARTRELLGMGFKPPFLP